MVARLSYDATEQDLESEFGRFGPIERVCLPRFSILRLLTRL
jgi:RNA recognition motif-containing protein